MSTGFPTALLALRRRLPRWLPVLACSALLCAGASAAWATTYYIDFNAADDSSGGTSKSTPWKHHPYMQGFTGTYSHAPGDVFVFRGGVTWPSTCFSMQIPAGGSAAGFDTYTVDPTWFAGASYSAPVWDGGYATLAGSQNMVQINSVPYITFNGLEARHFKATSGFGQGIFALYAANHIHWTNDYIHGWSLDASVTSDDAHGGIINVVSGGLSMTDVVIDGCTIENSELTGVRQNGVAIRQVNTVRGSTLHDVSSLVLFAGDFHNNSVYNITYPAGNASFDPAYHTNVLYLSLWNGNAAITTPATVYDNVYHDIGAGTPPVYFCPGEMAPYNQTLYVYNNLVYGANTNNMVIEIDPAGTTGNTGTVYAYNNTFVMPNGMGEAILCVNRGGNPQVANVVAQNNHVIGTNVTMLFGPYAASTVDHNLIQDPATATAQGYVLANLYQPTSATDGTVNQGVSEYSVFTTDITGAARPSTSPWDLGAYQFASTVTATPPTAPTGLHVIP